MSIVLVSIILHIATALGKFVSAVYIHLPGKKKIVLIVAIHRLQLQIGMFHMKFDSSINTQVCRK